MLDGAFYVRFTARFGKQVGDHFLARERRECQGPNEGASGAGHDHLNAEAFLLETTHQFGGLVSRNASGDAECDLHGRSEECYLRRLLPSFSSSTDLPGSNSYSINPWLTSSQATRVALRVRGFSSSGGAPAMIWRARRAAST